MSQSYEKNQRNYIQELRNRIINDEQVIPYVGFWHRFGAYLIDLIVVSSLQRIFVSLFSSIISVGSPLIYVLRIFILLGYFIGLTYFTRGQTLGKIICHIRIVQEDGTAMSLLDTILREGFMRYILYTIPILYLVTAISPKKQHLGDLVARTIVIPN